jgi:hypothetical protein
MTQECELKLSISQEKKNERSCRNRVNFNRADNITIDDGNPNPLPGQHRGNWPPNHTKKFPAFSLHSPPHLFPPSPAALEYGDNRIQTGCQAYRTGALTGPNRKTK